MQKEHELLKTGKIRLRVVGEVGLKEVRKRTMGAGEIVVGHQLVLLLDGWRRQLTSLPLEFFESCDQSHHTISHCGEILIPIFQGAANGGLDFLHDLGLLLQK